MTDIPIDLTEARAVAEQMQAAARATGAPDANVATSAGVFLWLLDMAEAALMQKAKEARDDQ